MTEPQVTVDVEKFFAAYEAKIAEMIKRVVYLEVENAALRDRLFTPEPEPEPEPEKKPPAKP
jgi:regulator of replication initiation timing